MIKRGSKDTRFKKGHVPWNKLGKGVTRPCETCGKEFYTPPARHKDKRGRFCSMKCRRGIFAKKANELVLNEDMAELIGIILGDGCIHYQKNSKSYKISILGNPIEDEDYMKKYVPSLIEKCIGRKTTASLAKNGALIIRFQDEAFRIFLHRLGVKKDKNKEISIPKEIKKNPKLIAKCIKGIADTDFTLVFTKQHNYPRITAHFKSKQLVKDMENFLRKNEFTLNTKYDYERKDKRNNKVYISNHINLDGPNNLNKWLELIGFANMRIITRYELWKQKGYLEPKTTLPGRLEQLERAGR